YHSFVVVAASVVAANVAAFCRGVDLATGRWSSPPTSSNEIQERGAQACMEALKYEVPPPHLPLVYDPQVRRPSGRYLHVDRTSGTLHPRRLESEWRPFTPLANGQPLLKGGKIMAAQGRGSVLAIMTFRKNMVLQLFKGPDGILLGEYPTAA